MQPGLGDVDSRLVRHASWSNVQGVEVRNVGSFEVQGYRAWDVGARWR